MQVFIKMMNKQLFALLQLLVIRSVITVVPDKDQLRALVKNYLLPDFVQGRFVQEDRQQFAIGLLLSDTQWLQFLYNPSANNDGEKPVIDPGNNLSPPDDRHYNNYIAAVPYGRMHAEEQCLYEMKDLLNAYIRTHHGRYPDALLLYSVIVPCKSCTDAIIDTLTKPPFDSIQTKVVAYTTNGSNCDDCDPDYTWTNLENSGILVTRVRITPEESHEIFTIRLMDE